MDDAAGRWAPAPGPGGRPEPILHESEPRNAEWPLAYQNGWVTPAARFFERNHFTRPSEKPGRWTLSVEGAVERPQRLELWELKRMAATALVAVLECSGNKRGFFTPPAEGTPWREGAVGNAEWGGVPLRLVLARAGVRPGAAWVRFTGADAGRFKETGQRVHFERALPMPVALDPDTLLVWEMNGEPLPEAHGGPLRLAVPGWYGMAWVKWLTRLEVRTRPFRGPFQVRDYVYLPEPGAYDRAEPVTESRVNSAIAWPADQAVVPPGDLVVRGFAWGPAPVTRVDVSMDGGRTWTGATLVEPVARHAWRLWHCVIPDVRPGRYRILARAADAAGHLQPAGAPWNAKGYGNNQISFVSITVSVRPPTRSK